MDSNGDLKRRSTDNRTWLKFSIPIVTGAILCWAGYVTSISIASGDAHAKVASMEDKIDKLLELSSEQKVHSAEITKDIDYIRTTMDRNATDSQRADEATNKRLDKIEEKLD